MWLAAVAVLAACEQSRFLLCLPKVQDMLAVRGLVIVGEGDNLGPGPAVTVGNLVPAGPGAPVLTTLVSVNPIYASFDADEPVVLRTLHEGAKGVAV